MMRSIARIFAILMAGTSCAAAATVSAGFAVGVTVESVCNMSAGGAGVRVQCTDAPPYAIQAWDRPAPPSGAAAEHVVTISY